MWSKMRLCEEDSYNSGGLLQKARAWISLETLQSLICRNTMISKWLLLVLGSKVPCKATMIGLLFCTLQIILHQNKYWNFPPTNNHMLIHWERLCVLFEQTFKKIKLHTRVEKKTCLGALEVSINVMCNRKTGHNWAKARLPNKNRISLCLNHSFYGT